MRFFKHFASFLGFRDEDQHKQEDADADASPPDFSGSATATSYDNLKRKGFSVPVQVTVERSAPPRLLVHCPAGDGGIQGLRWYARRLRIDEDGDIADEFLDEVVSSDAGHDRSYTKMKAKPITQPARVQNLALLPNGKIQHLVEHECKLQWV